MPKNEDGHELVRIISSVQRHDATPPSANKVTVWTPPNMVSASIGGDTIIALPSSIVPPKKRRPVAVEWERAADEERASCSSAAAHFDDTVGTGHGDEGLGGGITYDLIMADIICEKHLDEDHSLLVFNGVCRPSEVDVKAMRRCSNMDLSVADPLSYSGLPISKLKQMLVDVIRDGGRNDVAWVTREVHLFYVLNREHSSALFGGQPLRELVHTLYYVIVMYCDPTDSFCCSSALSMMRRYYDDPDDNILLLAKTVELLRQMAKIYGTSHVLKMYMQTCEGTSRAYKKQVKTWMKTSREPLSRKSNMKKMVAAINAGNVWEAGFRLALLYRIIMRVDLSEEIVWLSKSFPGVRVPLNGTRHTTSSDRVACAATDMAFGELWNTLELCASEMHTNKHQLFPNLEHSVAVRHLVFNSRSNYMAVDKLGCLLSCVMSLAGHAKNLLPPDGEHLPAKIQLVWKLCLDPQFSWCKNHLVTELGYYAATCIDDDPDATAAKLAEERRRECAECGESDIGDIELPPVDRPAYPEPELVNKITHGPEFLPNSVRMYASAVAMSSGPPLNHEDVVTSLQEMSVKETTSLYRDRKKGMIDVLSMQTDAHSQFGIEQLFYNNLCRKLDVPTFNGKFGMRVHNINTTTKDIAFDQEMGGSMDPWRSNSPGVALGNSCTPLARASSSASKWAKNGPCAKTRLFALLVLHLILGVKKDIKASDFVYSHIVGDFMATKVKCVGVRMVREILSDTAGFCKVLKMCLPLPKNWITILPTWCRSVFVRDHMPLPTPNEFISADSTPNNIVRLRPDTYESWKEGDCHVCMSLKDGYVFDNGSEIKLRHRCTNLDDCDSDSDHSMDGPRLRVARKCDTGGNKLRTAFNEHKLRRKKNKHAFEDSHKRKFDNATTASVAAINSMHAAQDFIKREFTPESAMAMCLQKRMRAFTTRVDQSIQESMPLMNVSFGSQDLVTTIVSTAAESHFINTNKLRVIINNVHTVAAAVFPFLVFDAEPGTLGVYDDLSSCDEEQPHFTPEIIEIDAIPV